MAEVILPGTYISVRDEGLISAGRVVSGSIGIVGTAERGPLNSVEIIGSFSEAQELYGPAGPWYDGGREELTLVRALEQVYNNGGRTVYAVRVGAQEGERASYTLQGSGGDLVTLRAATPGVWGNQIAVAVTREDRPGDAQQKDTYVRLVYGGEEERFKWSKLADFVAEVNKTSSLVVAKAAATAPDADDVVPVLTTAPAARPPEWKGAGLPPGPLLVGGASGASADDYEQGLELLAREIVNIVVLAGQDASSAEMTTALLAHLTTTAETRRERIGILGSGGGVTTKDIAGVMETLNSDRLIFVAPGIRASITNPTTRVSREVRLPGGYLAAAVAGLIASLPVQASPTNKSLNLNGLAYEFSTSELEKLVQSRVLAVEKREGFRVVKGITTATNSAWHQITTRRIVDYAIYGVRSACNPYIGKLNNERVRGAMKATLDAFLTRMVGDEALVGYSLEVTATRAQQIAGEVAVTMTLQPTFSIDFVKVTMYLG